MMEKKMSWDKIKMANALNTISNKHHKDGT